MLARIQLVVLLGIAGNATAHAEILPTYSIRELMGRAPVVVLAETIANDRSGNFRIREVLKGQIERKMTEIQVGHLESYLNPKTEPDWRLIDTVLLFLRRPSEGAYEMVESGIRLHSRDGKVWLPVQHVNPGGYEMTAEAGVNWEALLFRARTDAEEANLVESACEIADLGIRDRSLLDWIERRRFDLIAGREQSWSRLTPSIRNVGSGGMEITDLEANSLGELQLLPFTRVLQGRAPGDCWRAVILYAEINQGESPPGAAAAFSGRDGRRQLVSIARDDQQLDAWRRRALRLLADAAIVATDPPDSRERRELLDGLLPLLDDRDATRRGLAARALHRLAAGDAAEAEHLLETLWSHYRSERPGPVRNALAGTLYDLAGAGNWRRLTGHADASLALIEDLQLRDEKLCFWVTLRTTPAAPVLQQPVLIVEPVVPTGKASQTKRLPLPLPPRALESGWSGKALPMEVTGADLTPGTWRLRVTGVAGTDNQRWESEPRTVEVIVSDSSRPSKKAGNSVLNALLRSMTDSDPAGRRGVNPNDKLKRIVVLDGDPL